MPLYEYQGFDNQGHSQTGTLDAASANDAVSQLAAQGLRVQKVSKSLTQAGPDLSQRVMPVSIPPMVPGGSQGYSAAPPQSQYSNSAPPQSQFSSAPPRMQSQSNVQQQKMVTSRTYGEQETPFFRDADLALFFAQLSNILRAGISPVEAFQEMADRRSVKEFAREACRDIAGKVASGSTLADAMDFYPDLFPPGAVGAVRAGETGGYLWEACSVYAENQTRAKSFRRVFWWASLCYWSSVLTIPLFKVFQQGIDRLAATINDPDAATGGSGYVLQAYAKGLAAGFFGPWGIITILMFLVFLFGWRYTGRRQFLMLRHRLAATIWTVKRRAEADSTENFAYHLQRLGNSRIPPYRAFALAADAVPNRYHAEQLKKVSVGKGENVRLSQILYQANIFPQEYVPLVETGELTGQTDSALENVARQADGDRKYQENFIKFRAFLWAMLMVFGGSAILYAAVSRGLFDAVMREALK